MSYEATLIKTTKDEFGLADLLTDQAAKINANLAAIAAQFEFVEAVLHTLGSGVNYIKTTLTGGGATALDGIDGANLAGGEFAGVFLGTTPANLYFYVLSPDSGATEAAPNVIAPDANAGTKRWILSARMPRVWPGSAFPVATDDINSDHVAGDRWIYGGGTWTCVDHAAGAAIWVKVPNIGTGATDAAAGNHTHSGFASLVDGKLPVSQLPAIAINDTFPVATEAAMLALDAQPGDVALRSDESQVYILAGSDPTILANWKVWLYPGGGVTSVDGRAGVVTLGDLYEALANKGAPNGYPSLDTSSLVVEDPASASTTAGANKIPKTGAGGTLDAWISDAAVGTKGKIAIGTGATDAAPGNHTHASSVDVLTFTIDNGASPITTGVKRGLIVVPYACTITGWTLLSADNTSGSIVIDIWKDTYANFPPTVADTITASAKPTISSATKGQSSTLTGWTTAIAAGDILRFNVDSCATIMSIVLELTVTRT